MKRHPHERETPGDINVYASIFASVWCNDILVMAPEIWEGNLLWVYVYILILKSVLQSSTGLARGSSSHETGPWEGTFNQLGNKLTLDGSFRTSSLLKFQGC